MRLSRQHVEPLDGLRGIAILIVMLHHFEFLLPSGNLIGDAIKAVFVFGWSGVDLFFVLSGFLITGILLDTKEAQNYFSSFYARRILRIFPLYYSVLGIIVMVDRLLYRPWFDQVMAIRSDQIYYFLYLNNWMFLLGDSWHSNIIGHFWSLAIEEQFYLLWPACIWFTPRRLVLRVAVIGCGLAFILRVVMVAKYGPSQAVLQNTFARMDTLLAGACCAVIVRDESMIVKVRPWLSMAMWAALAGIFSIGFFAGELRKHGFYTQTIGFSMFSVGYSALLLHIFLGKDSRSKAQALFASAPLRSLGKYSYGVYVFHVPIQMVIVPIVSAVLGLGRNALTSILLLVALIGLSFVAAEASYDLFERRFLRLKDRFEPRFAEAPEAPSVVS